MRRPSNEQEVHDARSLTRVLEPHLLRAVTPQKVMEQLGYHLRAGFLDGEEADQASVQYHALDQVCCYDYFLSHEWLTGRFQKWLSLCFYNNFLLAVLASGSTALIVMFLEIFGVLPSWSVATNVIGNYQFTTAVGHWPVLVPPVVYVLMLLFWQHIRQLVRLKPIHVFFDRICVHQSDKGLKTAAILGIGGFLQQSNKMVVVWSPRYFTRLWCCYELATWMHLQRPSRQLIFVPTRVVSMILGCQVVTYGGVLYATVWNPEGAHAILILAIYLLLFSVTATFCFKYIINSLLEIQQQLTRFRVSSAACFCCSVEHRHPTSGHAIPCDKKLVCGTIAAWGRAGGKDITNCGERSSLGLQEFESYMTRVLVAEVIRQLGSRRTTLALTFASIYPWFWFFCSQIRKQATMEHSIALWRDIAVACGMAFVYLPFTIRFALQAAKCLSEASSGFRRAYILTLPPLVGCVALGLPVFLHAQQENPLPEMVVLVVFAIAFLLLSGRKVLVFNDVKVYNDRMESVVGMAWPTPPSETG